MYSNSMTAVKNIGCVRAATNILGDKWTPVLLRCIANENSVRFCRLQDSTEGINPRTLSARLSALETERIIEKVITPNSTRAEYRLTKKGEGLIPILQAMEEWGAHHRQLS